MAEFSRTQWEEERPNEEDAPEVFFVIAENFNGCWRFAERSVWEVVWIAIPWTRELAEKAERLAAGGAPQPVPA